VGLHLSIPIVDQNLKNINKQTATIQKDQLTINLEDTKLNLEKSLNDAVLNLMDQISIIELSVLSQRTAKESLELTQTSYESGAVNIVQLLDAQNNYLNAEQNKINAIYNYLLGTITIQRLIGDFHLLNSDAENLAFIQRFMDSLATKN
jgi:outer membrane protein TolC